MLIFPLQSKHLKIFLLLTLISSDTSAKDEVSEFLGQRKPPVSSFLSTTLIFMHHYCKYLSDPKEPSYPSNSTYHVGYSDRFWNPYFDILPKPDQISTPMYWTKEEM
jgi:hypothetical protein